jgi:hypothetical protein
MQTPAIVFIVLQALGIGIALVKGGFVNTAIAAAITDSILAWGGFFHA